MLQNLRTYTLAKEFYRSSRKITLPGPAKDQLSRAALSIALNLAEGVGRPTLKDRLKFYNISMGSLRECQAILELEELTQTEAWRTLDCLGASLYRLIQNAR